jgi:hypothetical protein
MKQKENGRMKRKPRLKGEKERREQTTKRENI